MHDRWPTTRKPCEITPFSCAYSFDSSCRMPMLSKCILHVKYHGDHEIKWSIWCNNRCDMIGRVKLATILESFLAFIVAYLLCWHMWYIICLQVNRKIKFHERLGGCRDGTGIKTSLTSTNNPPSILHTYLPTSANIIPAACMCKLASLVPMFFSARKKNRVFHMCIEKHGKAWVRGYKLAS